MPKSFQISLLMSFEGPPAAGRRLAGGGETLEDGERRFFGIDLLTEAEDALPGGREALGRGFELAALEAGVLAVLAVFAGVGFEEEKDDFG